MRTARHTFRSTAAMLLCIAIACPSCKTEETKAVILAPAPIVAVYRTGDVGYFANQNGGEVVLRGVNVNSLGEYWQFEPQLPPTLPFVDFDADFLAAHGFNLVRLILTWSLVEPEPGEYDAVYLAKAAAMIDMLWQRGIYTLVDLHQDAWGPTLAARDHEVCDLDQFPATGWDGAPGWATLVDEATARCVPVANGHPVRELSEAVQEAWDSFFENKGGPGGVGIMDRYAAMLGQVAEVLGPLGGVIGYDIMNEPNAIFVQSHYRALREMYIKAVDQIRSAEKKAGIASRIILFEPSAYWAGQASGGYVAPFSDDPQLAYGPHIYQGSIFDNELDDSVVQKVRDEAILYGGVPVLTGEWGGGNDRVTSETGYFAEILRLMDQEHWGGAMWLYQAACGDPHAHYGYAKKNERVYDHDFGLFLTHCDGNSVHEQGPVNQPKIDRMTQPIVLVAPGYIEINVWDPVAATLLVAGDVAESGNELLLFVPEAYVPLQLNSKGLNDISSIVQYGGLEIRGIASAGPWSISMQP